MKRRSDADLSLVVLGLLGWVAAAGFAGFQPLNTVEAEAPAADGGKVRLTTTNPAATGAACGFGVGGGLCFLAAGQASRRNGDGPPA